MMEVTKTGIIELPVIVVSNYSALVQSKHSWSSTIKVPMRHAKQDNIQRHVDGKVEEESEMNVEHKIFRAGVMLLLPLSADERYAKDLIDMNGGIVEIGSGWPSCEPKPKQLHIVWLDKPDLDCKWKSPATPQHSVQLMLLIGDRFVDALDVYRQQRCLLISSSVLSGHEQQVACELRLLLILIVKNLLSNRQLFENLKQGPNEELVLVSIINILVDVQLFDGKNAVSFETLRPLCSYGDPPISEDYARILKHKVLSDLIALLQSVVSLRLPSKESSCCTRLDEMEKQKDTRQKASYMQRAIRDIIDLLKHLWQAGIFCAETRTKGSLSTLFKTERINEVEGREKRHTDVQVRMLEIEWKMLLAVLGKKDPASFQNVLCNIHDENQRQLVETIAGPVGLVESMDGIGKKPRLDPWIVGPPANAEGGLQAKLGAKKMQKIWGVGEKQGNVGVHTNVSCGYYVKTDEKMPHQKKGSLNGDIQSGHVNEREVLERAHLHFPTTSNKLGHECISIQGNASECTPLHRHNSMVLNLPNDHADLSSMQEQGAGGHSQNQKNMHTTDEAHKADQEANPVLNLPLCAKLQQADNELHVMGPAALSSSQAVYCDDANLVFESSVLQSAIDSDVVDQAALEAAADSHIPDLACLHVASSSQATSYGGDADDNDQYEDVQVNKPRHRKRKNRKTYRDGENRQCSHHCRMSRSQAALRKALPFFIIVFVLPVTILGIIWFHTDTSTNLNLGSKRCREFAKGFLP